eukprot:scaffold98044_cov37-Cyclotella_meneghiniana.AAC.1
MHKPPHHLETTRIVECAIDIAMAEFTAIVADRRKELGHGFASLSTDFVTDATRREPFGVIIVDLIAECYDLEDGRQLFMSKETAARIADQLLSGLSKLANLEYPINFESVKFSKTIENVVVWIDGSTKCTKFIESDFNEMSADGASNAIGSIAELETRTREHRANDVGISTCIAHQNQRSGGYASGTHDFANPVNVALGDILKKSHTLQVRLGRSPNRINIYRGIMTRYNRCPQLMPKPAGDTRWDGRQDETRRANIIMGDVCKTFETLLAVDGDDYNELTEEEKTSGDITRLTYTPHDKMVLRQFEVSAMEAKYFSKYTQQHGNTNINLLLEIQMTLQNSRKDYFTMPSDISDSPNHTDLRKRKNDSVLVVRDGAEFTDDVDEKLFDETVDMDPTIETYRDEYVKDLARRLGMDDDRLPAAYTITALLNPMFGLKPAIVGSGLMNETQYQNAREGLLREMQDEFDKKNPPVEHNSDDNNSLDGSVTVEDSGNYKLAVLEFQHFEEYEKQIHIPKCKLGRCLEKKDSKGRVIRLGVGPVVSRGKDLPSKHNIADFLDKKGRLDIVRFFKVHKSLFPTLFIIVQREASRRVVEVGCERFFGISGYISQPRRSRLGVRNYERISMLSVILKCIFVDPELVAKEYLNRCKRGAWKKENTMESLKCFNLERIIEANLAGQEEPDDIDIQDYMGIELE